MNSAGNSPRGIVPISRNVVQMMKSRLDEVESATMQLTHEIKIARESGDTDRFSVLLSKTQSMETALQSLKLNFVNLSTLTRQPSDLEHKLVEMTDFYNEEIKRLANEMNHLKTDKLELKERKQQLEVDQQKLRLQLEDSLIIQREKEDIVQVERDRSERFLKKITEQERMINEEKQHRFNLDRMNQDLSCRLDEMGTAIQKEQTEGERFTSEFLVLKKSYNEKCSLLETESKRRQEMEIEMGTICQELDSKISALKTVKEENDMITKEMSNIHSKYEQLNEQLSKMHNMFQSHQKEKSSLETHCSSMSSELESLKQENDKLSSDLIKAQNNDESAKVITLRQQLRHVNKQRDELMSDNEILSGRVDELEEVNRKLHHEIEEHIEKSLHNSGSHKVEALQQRLESLKAELLALETEKGTILHQVDGAVDMMSTERSNLQSEINSYREQLSTALDQLEDEKIQTQQLTEQIKQLKTSTTLQTDFVGIDQYIKDLTNQKNELSYENGQLQSRCEELEKQTEELNDQITEYNKLKNKHKSTEQKLHKRKSELDEVKKSLKRSSVEMSKMESLLHDKDKELETVSKNLTDALNDCNALSQRIESLEEALQAQEQVHGQLERSLKGDQVKVTTSLESLMALHTAMQMKYEAVQIELGKKDSRINSLQDDNTRLSAKLQKVEDRLYKSDKMLSEYQSTRTTINESLELEIKHLKDENNGLTKSLQESLEKTDNLIQHTKQLEKKLSDTQSNLNTFRVQSSELASKLKLHEANSRTRIDELESALSSQKDLTYDKLDQQLKMMQKETESILSRNADLLQTNSQLKSQLEETLTERQSLIKSNNELREKYNKLKTSLSKYQNKVKELSKSSNKENKQIESLSSKCEKQQETIEHFVTQFKELQVEMKQLVQLHDDQTELLRNKERQLQDGEETTQQLSDRIERLQIQLKESQKKAREAELKLTESNNDTLMATDAFEDMESFYKNKFISLTHELSEAKKQQLSSEWTVMENQQKYLHEKEAIEATAHRARDMLEESRRTVSRLADNTEQEINQRSPRHTRSPTKHSRSPDRSVRFPPNRQYIRTSGPSDISIDSILQSSQRTLSDNRNYHHLSPRRPQDEALSPFASSSQKLDAVIFEMEKRHLI